MRQKVKICEYVDAPTPAPPVSRVELTTALRQLHLNKAAGSDRVSNEMILKLSKKNLDRVHNLITTGQVPTAWKLHNLCIDIFVDHVHIFHFYRNYYFFLLLVLALPAGFFYDSYETVYKVYEQTHQDAFVKVVSF